MVFHKSTEIVSVFSIVNMMPFPNIISSLGIDASLQSSNNEDREEESDRKEARDLLFVHGPEVEVGCWEEAEARAHGVGMSDDFLFVLFFFFSVVDGSAFCK